jgi:hypothetical protein
MPTDIAQGDFTDYEFQAPIFIVTHHIPERVAKGESERLKFIFVTEGIAQAGLVDELAVGIMPVLLGEGLRILENVAGAPIALEKIGVTELPAGGTHFRSAS